MQIPIQIKSMAMTMIELLIAIGVFSVGIMWVMVTINANLSNLVIVKSKITSTMLAREWLEIIYNIRNTNVIRLDERDFLYTDGTERYNMSNFAGDTWLAILANISLNPAQKFDLQKIELSDNFLTNLTNSRLYEHFQSEKWNPVRLSFWNHNPDMPIDAADGQKFGRYITISNLNLETDQWGSDNIWWLLSGKIYKIGSIVPFAIWAKTGSIILESMIADYDK